MKGLIVIIALWLFNFGLILWALWWLANYHGGEQ